MSDFKHILDVAGLTSSSNSIISSIAQNGDGTKFAINYGDEVFFCTLKRASEAGTQVHDAIQRLCEDGEISDLPEVKNFLFLQRQYNFEVMENEVPVILFLKDEPISAGRLDMVIRMDGEIGGADIKRTSSLDKDYLFYQLNLYRIAYEQCYGVEWKFLKGIHLKDNIRKFAHIPINAPMAWELVHEYMEVNNE